MSLLNQRGFRCKVQEGTYGGTLTVWVNAEAIENFGNDAIEEQAKRVWERRCGSRQYPAYFGVEILEEVYNED